MDKERKVTKAYWVTAESSAVAIARILELTHNLDLVALEVIAFQAVKLYLTY